MEQKGLETAEYQRFSGHIQGDKTVCCNRIAPGGTDKTCREDFNAWVEHASARRDFTIELLEAAKTDGEKARQIEKLREELNQL